ncbi:MAG: peptidoglycan-binding protein [Candidatus Competibacteraceae bacterium]|nr:peptidoglycan-binding protein [Candidatus Competibacteraceae bacterium]
MKVATALKAFSGSQFVGKAVLADEDFIPLLERLNQLAAREGILIHVTSSARQQGGSVPGAIVRPASRSNHLIGHAIDMNLVMGGDFFNSRALGSFSTLPGPIQTFLNAVRNDNDLRWGGDFTTPDPVHIDDGFNLKDSAGWDDKFPIIQEQLLQLLRPAEESGQPRLLFLTRPYMQGEDIRLIQQKLIDRGFDMNADGIFGPLTDSAVTAFQRQQGLEPDGIVGPGTRRALGL